MLLVPLGLGKALADISGNSIKARDAGFVSSCGFERFNKCNDCGDMTSGHKDLCSLCGSVDIDREAVGIKFSSFHVYRHAIEIPLGIYSKEGVNNALDEFLKRGYITSGVEKYRGKQL